MPSQSPSSRSISRLNIISNHIMGSTSSPWAFTADVVPQAPEDPLFGLMAAYRKDTSPKKVDLGIGAYRDNNAKPWILPVVKKVRAVVLKLSSLRPMLMSLQADEILRRDPDLNHEYLPIAGLVEFTSAARKLILGTDSPAIKENRVCLVHSRSSTRAS
jgi:aspartate aminotransferase, cytoplasmic